MCNCPAAVQDAVEPVVVLRWNRIQLVIVAPGAGDGQTLKRLGQGIDLVVRHIQRDLPKQDAVIVSCLSEPEEGSSDDRLVSALLSIDTGPGEQVASDVLPDKLVVRHIGVQSADEVVAITPGAHDFVVPLVASRLRITNDVQPVACPLLPEMGRCEQAIYESLVRGRRGIVYKL